MVVFFDILKAIIVRFILLIHALVAIWRVTVSYEDPMYWLLAVILVLFVAESFYTVIRRKGREYQRFMPCFLFYLGCVLPCIWLLELDKSRKYMQGNESALDQPEVNQTVSGLVIPTEQLTPNTWILLVEEMMPYFLFVTRWILPRGKVTREQLVELLFAFIGIGGDIMEFFSLIGEQEVRTSLTLNYVVLAIWSFSVLQFVMTITVIHQPKRQRNITVVVETTKDPDEDLEFKKFRNEIFAIFLTMGMQDLPFLIVRVYTMVTFSLTGYSLIFFSSKNVMIIGLLFYKVAILCQKRYCPNPDEEDDDDSGKGSARWGSSKILNTHGSQYIDPYTAVDISDNGVGKNHIHPPANNAKTKADKKKKETAKVRDTNKQTQLAFSNPTNDLNSQINNPQGSSLLPRSSRPSPTASRASSKHSVKDSLYLEIDHTTPREDESSDTGVIQMTKPPKASKKLSGSSKSSKKQTPSHTPKPTPAGTPKHTPAPSITSFGDFGVSAPSSLQDSPPQSPTSINIILPPVQTARPGDPGFKPYVSVLRLE
ncbi:transmembrane protein 26-like [Physella acuta]|uniref:transmembrane protein 26-like n=1 Tax=Physella acuta TaxID=109671 RepID=UPI0027DCD995|nr:transmembrane protein 26-like [Physella acuta]